MKKDKSGTRTLGDNYRMRMVQISICIPFLAYMIDTKEFGYRS